MQKNQDWSSFQVTNQIFDTAFSAVQAGRACLLGYFGKINNIQEKQKADLVSEADKESEEIIKKQLQKFFPESEFLGEEEAYLTGTKVGMPATDKPRWILDPLDGTTNFVHQFPIYCISLALEVNKQIEIAIIDVPMLNQTWTAMRGEGAFCNGEKISVSKTTYYRSK